MQGWLLRGNGPVLPLMNMEVAFTPGGTSYEASVSQVKLMFTLGTGLATISLKTAVPCNLGVHRPRVVCRHRFERPYQNRPETILSPTLAVLLHLPTA